MKNKKYISFSNYNISYSKLDRYAILMISSSKLAFQIISATTAFVAIVTSILTGHLLSFHIYLGKLKNKYKVKMSLFINFTIFLFNVINLFKFNISTSPILIRDIEGSTKNLVYPVLLFHKRYISLYSFTLTLKEVKGHILLIEK